MARLQRYAERLAQWQARINLVSPETLADLWSRHMLDSAQLLPLLPAEPVRHLDLGSGAGFPGLVLAIMTGRPVTLVESDQRKSVFLRDVSRETSAYATVVARRIESLPIEPAGLITARALAPLSQLLTLAQRLITPDTVLLLPKGRNVEAELTKAAESWTMRVERHPSITDPAATILRLTEVTRA